MDFTFWLNCGFSPNFGLSERLNPKSEIAQREVYRKTAENVTDNNASIQ